MEPFDEYRTIENNRQELVNDSQTLEIEDIQNFSD